MKPEDASAGDHAVAKWLPFCLKGPNFGKIESSMLRMT